MNVFVIGSGGREHTLVWKLAQSSRITRVYCAPGNAGISQQATCVPIEADDLPGLRQFAQDKQIDLTVIGPEAPLALGIADLFRHNQLKVFGPTKNAARIESSKAFAKDLMIRQHIPTAESRTFESASAAISYLDSHPVPLVVKADGLAQGKGVVVAHTHEEAREAVLNMLERQAFGKAGHRVIIEEYLEGEELTLMAFADGKTVVPMLVAQDYKRVGVGDTGSNTGGMGAYAPALFATPALCDAIMRDVLYPAIEGMSRVGSPFYGVIYAGVMVNDGVPYVLEFNARFGDPETQVVLPLLKTDLVDVLEAVVEHRLEQLPIEWSEEAAVCVVISSRGYPGPYPVGMPISGISDLAASDSATVFHAGTAWNDSQIVTSGGRVLGVTAVRATLAQARCQAYETVQTLTFDGHYFRQDIASRVLQ